SHGVDRLVGGQHGVCEKREVDERRCVSVTPFGMARRCSRVFCNDDFETLLEQFAQMRFDTHVRQHPAQDDPADTALAQLQYEIVCLRTKYSVRADYDGLAVIDVRLESLEPVGPRLGEAFEIQSAAASEHFVLNFISFQGPVEFPSVIRGKEIMRRDEDFVAIFLRGFEDTLHVLDRLILLDTRADERPRDAFFAQDFILRIDEYHCGIGLVDLHNFTPRSCTRASRLQSRRRRLNRYPRNSSAIPQ